MSAPGFPAAYPGDDPNIVLDAQIDLAARALWHRPEFRTAMVEDGYENLPEELPPLTLQQAVDLMLRAFWRRDSELARRLQNGDSLAAAAFIRSQDSPLDDVRIAPLNAVADVIEAIVKRLVPDAKADQP